MIKPLERGDKMNNYVDEFISSNTNITGLPSLVEHFCEVNLSLISFSSIIFHIPFCWIIFNQSDHDPA